MENSVQKNKSIVEFVKVGFEFTASANAKTDTDSEYFEINNLYYRSLFGSGWTPSSARKKLKQLPPNFEWINENYSYDDCGCEVATPIIENISDVTKYFRSFKSFTRKYGFTTDLNKAICGLGGCHIHLDLSWLEDKYGYNKGKTIKARLLTNIAIFMTNNPQLNWAFNDFNDNTNANSLLIKNDGGDELSDICDIMCYESEIKPFLKDTYPLRAFITKPLEIDLYKCFAIKYNEGYDTVEFRIFDMPNDLKRHLLHYEVAMGIYNYCYKLACGNKTIKLEYNDEKEIANISASKAIRKLKESMKTIGIAYDRVEDLEFNIKTRYKWTVNVNGKVKDLSEDNCYLL